jgi:3-hydroxyisobutyrate dehydrogenase
MSDLILTQKGRAGCITLNRPDALNALTYQMCSDIEAQLRIWRDAPSIELIIIDATGDKAFCAGGDIADLYASAQRQDYAFGQKFWADEYRLNALIDNYPKPYVAFMQGFVMGGGVGVSCHGSHRIVGETSQIAMPEVGIGLVPDVGGSALLAAAPGHLGEYLGITATRMNAADAIFVGFADHFIPQDQWDGAKSALQENGIDALATFYAQTPVSDLRDALTQINAIFSGARMRDILAAAENSTAPFATGAAKAIGRNSPLAMAVALDMIRSLRTTQATVAEALVQEYRFTARAIEFGDFAEGIRAAIIDKDKNPQWKHHIGAVPQEIVDHMRAPLGDMELNLTGE